MDAAVDIAARISGATTDAATRVTNAIRDAAKVTGAGFEYMLNTALRESNLNPNAKARSSSATGLFQFVDQTWLATMKQSGAALGYGKYADAISKTASGRYAVSDPAMRQQIFALRKDPTANALLAGAFANSNAQILTQRIGRKPTDGELYMAHFLGASGAARFINATQANPNARAAGMFPKAAHANHSIFYNANGSARSLQQVYANLVQKHNVMTPTQLAQLSTPSGTAPNASQPSATAPSATQLSAAQPSVSQPSVSQLSAAQPSAVQLSATPPSASQPSAAQPNANAAPGTAVASSAPRIMPLAFFQDIPATSNAAAPTPVSATPAVTAINAATAADPATSGASGPVAAVPLAGQATAPARAPTPMFVSLYQGDDGPPVGSAVRELWGSRRVAAIETPQAVTPTGAASGADAPTVNAPLDLLQFMRPSVRGAG
jgi:hypothetical protein